MINLPILSDEALHNETPRERFWRSVAHFKRDEDLASRTAQEFSPEAAASPSDGSRRRFMQLMGASVALAGLSACRRPVEYIAPYSRKPEEIIPGISRYFATAMPTRTGTLQPLLVESHEGRPTKAEGNPDHPDSTGSTDGYAQASVLNLYDPDRSRTVQRAGADSSWDEFVAFAQGSSSRRIAVVAEPTTSPTLLRLRDALMARYPGALWVPFSANGDDTIAYGTQQATGQALTPRYDFTDARVIVSLDADFVGPSANDMVRNNRTFAASRKLDAPTDTLSRLYVAESAYTTTGGMADHRIRVRACDVPAFGAALASALGVNVGGGDAFMSEAYRDRIRVIAEDLRSAGSGGVVVAGEHLPAEAHAIAAAINAALGSSAVSYSAATTAGVDGTLRPQGETMRSLVQAMRSRAVDTVIFLGTNPVYNGPEGSGMADAIQAVETSIHVGTHFDETAEVCEWHIPASHYLEAWGDGRSADGTLSIIQPLISPLHASKSYVEVISTLVDGSDRTGYDLVRETWRSQLSGDFENAWRQVIHDGFLPDTAATPITGIAATAPASVRPAPRVGVELVIKPDPALLSGAFSNNTWMQELPDPVTKITWDNVAMMSPATAAELGVESEYRTGQQYVSIVNITAEGRSIEIPAWVLPGHADGSVTLYQGYGRAMPSGRENRDSWFFDVDEYTDVYGNGAVGNSVGVNVDRLRPVSLASVITGATVEATGGEYMIATTQDHAAIDLEKRPAVRRTTYDEYLANPAFAREAEALLPGGEYWRDYPELWDGREPSQTPAMQDNPYYQNQWGMTIDLNACTGCNACVVACQSENNIQVVGKDEVARGREMHWMRLDRYFVTNVAGSLDEEDVPVEPEMVMQPVLCQHCENAPCESVCPVAATVHSPDGTNQMIYNRCIGTRYCANNCPYKVRRFNFFNWTHTLPEEVWLAHNPNVTVRSRGVMEKCSFCVQRIREANLEANVEKRSVRDGDVVTACQQACPAEAITFGDLNDPTSAVALERQHPRAYEMLAYLNVKPRVSYLARVTNPNPRFAALVPLMTEPAEVDA